MENTGPGEPRLRALQRYIKRKLADLAASAMFKVSVEEGVSLAKRAFFIKYNREMIVKAALRPRLVKDVTYIQEELSWVTVFDGMSPTDPPYLGRCKEVDAVLAPFGRDYRYKHAADFEGHGFSSEDVIRLHLIVLETAVEAALFGGSAKERQDALRWIFRPQVVLHPNPGMPPVQTSRIPFNFRLCCRLAGADPDEVQERVMEYLTAQEKETYEVFKLSGDGEICRRSLWVERRGRTEDPNLGGGRNAPSGP